MSIDNFKDGMMKLCEPKKNILTKSNPKKPTFTNIDYVMFNKEHKNRAAKINYIPSKSKKKKTLEPTTEELSMQKRIRKERAFIIQTKIVKIMKSYKTYNVQQLIVEVISHVSMFTAEPEMIKD